MKGDGGHTYTTLIFTDTLFTTLMGNDFSATERRRFVRALQLLDTDERHPSLRVHQLRGEQAGTWSASASDELRITFERLPEGKKRLLVCSRHYAR